MSHHDLGPISFVLAAKRLTSAQPCSGASLCTADSLGQVEREAGLACKDMCWEMEFWDEVCDLHRIVKSVEPM